MYETAKNNNKVCQTFSKDLLLDAMNGCILGRKTRRDGGAKSITRS